MLWLLVRHQQTLSVGIDDTATVLASSSKQQEVLGLSGSNEPPTGLMYGPMELLEILSLASCFVIGLPDIKATHAIAGLQ